MCSSLHVCPQLSKHIQSEHHSDKILVIGHFKIIGKPLWVTWTKKIKLALAVCFTYQLVACYKHMERCILIVIYMNLVLNKREKLVACSW